jgi:3-oxoadipate enol-lactonase
LTVSQIAVPGGRLHVVDEGEGPPIVLLHAGVADLRAWDDAVPPLVAAGYRVIRFDTRGYGQSTTTDVEFSHRADLLAVLDATGVQRAALVGNSQGGQIANDTAIEAPERVVAVVGLAGGVSGFDGGSTPEEDPILAAYERVDSADPLDVDALTDFEVQVWLAGPLQPLERVSEDLRARFREMCRPLNEPGRVLGQPVRLDPPADDRLAELACPVLAIAGMLDFSECVSTARHLEEAAPNARALIWDDVAHMVAMEQPERTTRAIVDFVEPLRPWA